MVGSEVERGTGKDFEVVESFRAKRGSYERRHKLQN
jgi:hypothetical protein